ncbi:hypothetical protein GQ55_1G167500 [Panicum hallii var. hallii]|uniref:Uncharacterized protein n=1 Tax=Panicum hallii var. hallii TaxID=1504633 RepID=A0A2T7F5R1_9POAL|nr:hypothetical protein GQ55_1G167500 [Panicum hallii var. hallii]
MSASSMDTNLASPSSRMTAAFSCCRRALPRPAAARSGGAVPAAGPPDRPCRGAAAPGRLRREAAGSCLGADCCGERRRRAGCARRGSAAAGSGGAGRLLAPHGRLRREAAGSCLGAGRGGKQPGAGEQRRRAGRPAVGQEGDEGKSM